MQLPLNLDLHENQTLDNYCWRGNEVIQSQLKLSLQSSGERFIYLSGKSGAGKSHILQAITHQISSNSIYLPLEEVVDYGLDVFDGLEQLDVICLDNIEKIGGNRELEIALFHLYNRIRDNNHSLLFISGKEPISNLSIQLPDLRSRITWGLSFHLNELAEEDKLKVLEQKAVDKGFKLPAAVGQYLINHCARDMHQLTSIIDTLDKASLAAKRKLTVPFVKQILNL